MWMTSLYQVMTQSGKATFKGEISSLNFIVSQSPAWKKITILKG